MDCMKAYRENVKICRILDTNEVKGFSVWNHDVLLLMESTLKLFFEK